MDSTEQEARGAIAEIEKTLKSQYLKPSQIVYAVACICEKYSEATETAINNSAILPLPLEE